MQMSMRASDDHVPWRYVQKDSLCQAFFGPIWMKGKKRKEESHVCNGAQTSNPRHLLALRHQDGAHGKRKRGKAWCSLCTGAQWLADGCSSKQLCVHAGVGPAQRWLSHSSGDG